MDPRRVYNDKGQLRINFCQPKDIGGLHGVGRKYMERICSLRDTYGNITPQILASLRISKHQELVGHIDFEPFPHGAGYKFPQWEADTRQQPSEQPELERSDRTTDSRLQQQAYLQQLQNAADKLSGPPGRYSGMGSGFGAGAGPGMGSGFGFMPGVSHLDTYVQADQTEEQDRHGFVPGQRVEEISEYPDVEWSLESEGRRVLTPGQNRGRVAEVRGRSLYADQRCDSKSEYPEADESGYRPGSNLTTGGRRSQPAADTRYMRHQLQPESTHRHRASALPKSISYDGKKDWKSFITKFNMFAKGQNWTATEKKENLCWCLEDKAGEFFSRLLDRDPNMHFYEILEKLERRFDLKELPETAQVHFTYASQKAGETLGDWADRVVTLAISAYPDLTDGQIYRHSITRFCQGCADKRAGHYTINQRPATMEEALDKIRWFQHTDRIMNERKREVRSVVLPTSDEEMEYDYGTYSVARAFQAEKPKMEKKVHFQQYGGDSKQYQSSSQQPDESIQKMGKLEDKVEKMDGKLDKLTQQLETLVIHMGRSRTTMRSRSPSRSPTGKRCCFQCGEEGHFKMECPQLVGKREQVTGAARIKEDLNDSGSVC